MGQWCSRSCEVQNVRAPQVDSKWAKHSRLVDDVEEHDVLVCGLRDELGENPNAVQGALSVDDAHHSIEAASKGVSEDLTDGVSRYKLTS